MGVSFREKFGGELAAGSIDDTRVVVLKPMEYMNVSGHAVQRAAQFHKVAPEQIVVAHDEIDFAFGRVKVKSGGGHGGHNGLRSIIDQLGSGSFTRVRVGVGRPTREDGTPIGSDNERSVANYVLSDFPSALEREVEELAERAADAAATVVTRGVRKAMNEFNKDQPTAG